MSMDRDELEYRQRMGLLMEGYKVLAGLSDPDPFKIQRLVEQRILTAQTKLSELRGIIKVKDEGLNWGKPRLDYRRIHDETFGSLDTQNPFDEALNHHEGKE